MKRRALLASVALGSVGATAGCINLAGGGGGDGGDGGDGGPGTTNPGPDNFGLDLCSETADPTFRISEPSMEVQSDQNRVLIRFTLDYVGPDQDAFSVSPTINVLMYDENGEQVGTLNKAETMSPTATKDLEYSYTEEDWNQVTGFGFDVLGPQSDGDVGCYLPDGIPEETAEGGDGGS